MVKMHFKCWRMPITVGPNLMRTGWYGGQWVKYVAKNTVDFASFNDFAGFMLLGYKLKDGGYVPYNYENDGVSKWRTKHS